MDALLFETLNTLNRTVFDNGRHCPVRVVWLRHAVVRLNPPRTNGHCVTDFDSEARGYMGSEILMALLVPICERNEEPGSLGGGRTYCILGCSGGNRDE